MNRFVCICLVSLVFGSAQAKDAARELSVHLVQANNNSPYAVIRAKFEPGEVADPWAVRFFDQQGRTVPYFVWDSVTWKVAREGREDWNHCYAILNHHPGSAPEAQQMRADRLQAAKRQYPELGEQLAAQDSASTQFGDSICAAIYLVRHEVPALAKDKLKLKIYATRQYEPKQQKLDQDGDSRETSAEAGELRVDGLPQAPNVHWKGKSLFRYAGYKIGDKSATKDGSFYDQTHADPRFPFSVEITSGIITKIFVQGRTKGRAESKMDWQCTYWLFPEGCYVSLKGFSLENTVGYLGGGISLAMWEMPNRPQEIHAPLWETPWWLYRLNDEAHVSIHPFPDVPLAVGYGNNPFCASAPASYQVRSSEKTKGENDGILELNWSYELADNRVYRLFHPRLDGDRSFDLAEVTDLRETLLSHGKLTKVPKDAVDKDGRLIWPAERIQRIEDALSYVKWKPRQDWLYRQYIVGLGETVTETEASMRSVLGAAAGWIDRPWQESEIAELIVQCSLRKSAVADKSGQVWTTLPSILHQADGTNVRQAMQQCSDPVDVAADAMERIRKCVAGGGHPITGTTKDGGEGWLHNPAYAASDVPVALQFMEHFGLYDAAKHRRDEYVKSLREWADFSLEVLGGDPLDWEQLRDSYRSMWSNRLVMLAPLMLRAYRETKDKQYAKAARLLFDEVLMGQVKRSPHGYFWAWGHRPVKAEPFDLNYNVAAYDRGIIDFWAENQLNVIGKDQASQFVAAQARYLSFSGQLLDTLETDNMTAIESLFPGGIPFAIGGVAIFLYDDFAFYRGLVGDLIRWGVIDDGGTLADRQGRRNFFTLKIGSRGAMFWAYGIGQDSPPPSSTARRMLESAKH